MHDFPILDNRKKESEELFLEGGEHPLLVKVGLLQ
jgi:hypothetical protein